MMDVKQRRHRFIPMEWEAWVPIGCSVQYTLKSNYTPLSRGMNSFQETRTVQLSISEIPSYPHLRNCSIKTLDHRVLLNGRSSSTANILEETAAVYNYLDLQVNQDGSVLKVNNFENIQKNWLSVQLKLSKVNSGTNFEQFVAGIDREISTQEQMQTALLSFKNFGLLLQPIYGRHDNFQGKEKTKDFTGSRRKVSVIETTSLQHPHSEEQIDLKIIGTPKHGRTFPNYLAHYKVDKKTSIIESAEATVFERINGEDYTNKFELLKKDK